jgi:hypothetical protein
MTDTQSYRQGDKQGKPRFLAGGRHPVNVGHLVMGLAFLGLVGVWALIVNDVVDNEDIRWLLPVPWVLAGLGGLAALAISGGRKYATRATGWVDTPPAEEPVVDSLTEDTLRVEDEQG